MGNETYSDSTGNRGETPSGNRADRDPRGYAMKNALGTTYSETHGK